MDKAAQEEVEREKAPKAEKVAREKAAELLGRWELSIADLSVSDEVLGGGGQAQASAARLLEDLSLSFSPPTPATCDTFLFPPLGHATPMADSSWRGAFPQIASPAHPSPPVASLSALCRGRSFEARGEAWALR